MARLERTTRRIVSAVLFVGLFIGGILLRVDEPVWGTVLMLVSVDPAAARPVRRGVVARPLTPAGPRGAGHPASSRLHE